MRASRKPPALETKSNQGVKAEHCWSGLDLAPPFHDTKQGMQCTVSGSACRTVIDRLLSFKGFSPCRN